MIQPEPVRGLELRSFFTGEILVPGTPAWAIYNWAWASRRTPMTAEPFDIRAAIERAAEMERECPLVGTGPDGACTTCGGTGRVVPFAVLRDECVDFLSGVVTDHLHEDSNGNWHHAEGCPGWQPIFDEDKATWLAVEHGPWVEVHCWKGGTGLWFFTVRDAAGCTGHGDDPIADYAFWRAVAEWLEKQEVMK